MAVIGVPTFGLWLISLLAFFLRSVDADNTSCEAPVMAASLIQLGSKSSSSGTFIHQGEGEAHQAAMDMLMGSMARAADEGKERVDVIEHDLQRNFEKAQGELALLQASDFSSTVAESSKGDCSWFEATAGDFCKSEHCQDDLKKQIGGEWDFDAAWKRCKEDSTVDSCTACEDRKHDWENTHINYCVGSCSIADGCTFLTNDFPKACHVGVTCNDCRREWLQIGFGYDTCQGNKVYAQAEYVGQTTLVDTTEFLTLDTIWERAVDGAIGAGLTELLSEPAKASANEFKQIVYDFISILLKSDQNNQITQGTKYRAEVKGQLALGAAARTDDRVARNVCDGEYYCIGKETTASVTLVGGKSMKFFACIRNDLAALRLEGGYDAGTLQLELVPEPIPGPAWHTAIFPKKVVRKACYPTLDHKMKTNNPDDGWCGFVNAWWHADKAQAKDQCNQMSAHCVWAEQRPEGCFANWNAKRTWPRSWENTQGLCPYFTSESDCDKHNQCYWGTQPCNRQPKWDFMKYSSGCKTERQLWKGLTWRNSNYVGKRCVENHAPWCEDCHKHRRHCLSKDCRHTMDFCGFKTWNDCRMQVAILCANHALHPSNNW